MRAGDIIVSFDGVALSTSGDFVGAVRAKQPGDQVQVVVDRSGQTLVLTATLTAFPGTQDTPQARAFFGVAGWSRDYVQVGVVESLGRAVQDVVSTAAGSVRGVFTVLNPINLADNLTSEVADPLTRPSTVVGASQIGGDIDRARAGDETGAGDVVELQAGLAGGHPAIGLAIAERARRIAAKAQLTPVVSPPRHLPTMRHHASKRCSQRPTPGTTHFAAMCLAFATNNSPLPTTAPPCEPHKAGGYSPSAHAIIDPTSGAAQSYRQLREGPAGADWIQSAASNEIGRLAQGFLPHMPSGTNTIHFIRHTDIPANRRAT